MKAQTIDPKLQMELFEIATRMKSAGLSEAFITAAVDTAKEFEGVYDLIKLWDEEKEQEAKNEIVADIQDMIDDTSQKKIVEGTYIRFDDLDAIAKDIRAFKDNLLLIVEDRGGVSKLSKLTGIPQPSLSRLFNTTSMPRRTTLLKIARALNLGAVEIATEWKREV